ncbi:GyrI-like domain-containing protein [Patescibacteria group bacterium]
MKKIDYKKDFKQFYLPSAKEPVIIKVPKMNFLMVNGKGGNPSKNKDFSNAIEAIYSVAYTIKFTLKFAKVGPEYTVPPLEALWWTSDGSLINVKKPDKWRWSVIMTQPAHVTQKHVRDAIKLIMERAAKKKKTTSPVLKVIKLGPFTEGECVQIMHIGPYSAEDANIKKMHDFAFNQGYKLTGKHHEIYISDPRRVAPSKIKTVLRQPVKK